MTAPMQRLIAQVEATNEKGVRLEGEWRNFSRYAKPEAIQAHSAGMWVDVQLDGAGFIRVLMVTVSKPAPAEPDEPPVQDLDEPPAAERPQISKDVLIVRQSMLKAAVDFAGTRPDLKSADVLKLACAFEKWVWR